MANFFDKYAGVWAIVDSGRYNIKYIGRIISHGHNAATVLKKLIKEPIISMQPVFDYHFQLVNELVDDGKKTILSKDISILPIDFCCSMELPIHTTVNSITFFEQMNDYEKDDFKAMVEKGSIILSQAFTAKIAKEAVMIKELVDKGNEK